MTRRGDADAAVETLQQGLLAGLATEKPVVSRYRKPFWSHVNPAGTWTVIVHSIAGAPSAVPESGDAALKTGLYGGVNYVEIPPAITGVKSRVIGFTQHDGYASLSVATPAGSYRVEARRGGQIDLRLGMRRNALSEHKPARAEGTQEC